MGEIMLNGSSGNGSSNSLLNEYSALLGDAVLRQRTRMAEDTARIESEMAGRVKSEFISNMSHELRTPLNTIIGFSRLLNEHDSQKLGEAEIIQYSQLINDAASKLLAVINDILDISKMQSGRFTLDNQEISLRELLDDVVQQQTADAQTAGVSIHYKSSLSLPTVRGEQTKLHQAFLNILANAIKFTPPGGEVHVEANARGRARGGVNISIRDSGVGMSDEELRISMTPFGQVDGSHSRWREGTGLGLPIARALIELHGGTVNIESSKSNGTNVLISLPSRNEVSAVVEPDHLNTDEFQVEKS